MRLLYFALVVILVLVWAGSAPAADCGCKGCPLQLKSTTSSTTTTTTKTAVAPAVIVVASRQPSTVRRTIIREFEGPRRPFLFR